MILYGDPPALEREMRSTCLSFFNFETLLQHFNPRHRAVLWFSGLIDGGTAFHGASGGAMVAAGAALNISTEAMYGAVCEKLEPIANYH